ncbi:unnamed protein product [Echinostoma caproni]|uniref:Chorein_N domain-containing protein n=1 Tax=Echinostoma caproni TaxID=27848 RepID=A0A183AD86_9TREM|nr:unnamed protein product [Echinostoma caproni]
MQRYFKPETYIGKLVMSYLNTYVKLRNDQVATSLWDGDVILTHLEVRCESLDHLLPYPLHFCSGQVHELRIHIPWTKLNSENIVITLNTVECILALKKSVKRANSVSTCEPSVADYSSPDSVRGPEFTANEAPGYLQSYLNRLISNVRFVVQNLNVKFIQDDIVLSMSSNRAEFFPTDADWQPNYQFDQSSHNYMTHRKLQIFDITLCLDHAGPSGFVDVYEEPIVYRFHLSCLIELVFSTDSKLSAPTTALVTTLDVHTEKMEFRLSPAQIHALIRLLDVFIAIHTETVDWSMVGPSSNRNTADQISETITPDVDSKGIDQPGLNSAYSSEELDNRADTQTQGSWASWVWSFVPSLLPPNTESSEDEADEPVSPDQTRSPRRSAAELFYLVYEEAEKQLVSGFPRISGYLDVIEPDISSVEVGGSSTNRLIEASEINRSEEYTAAARKRRRRIRTLKRQVNGSSLLFVGVFVDQLVIQLTPLNSCSVNLFSLGSNQTDLEQCILPRSRGLFFSELHTTSRVNLTAGAIDALPGPVESSSSVADLPTLELGDYYTKLSDVRVRKHFPALWLDFVSIMDVQNRDINISECKS